MVKLKHEETQGTHRELGTNQL